LGKFSEDTVRGAKENGIKDAFYFDDMDELVNKLLAHIREGDCLLIKGSRNMRMERIAEKLKEGLCSTA
ncbi:MAG: UDP-N-acetylmuramoyl-tripeptide--D-alanyl-D-alanine ligase, partial [Candidatus Aerophobetes bacterium]|nr:UDP-N-acetylmuramoyl-tripeptide--D-alanyl-D-alanine ligase [Candidatus Aerophobetes bacterium]